MADQLSKDIHTSREEYQKRILESIENEVYECERYKINSSLVIGDVSAGTHINEFSQEIRETDKFILLDSHTCCMIFPFTDTAQGVKAASNLLSKFEMKHFSEKVYFGIVNIEDCKSPTTQVGHLFDILEFAISNRMNNIPLNTTSFQFLSSLFLHLFAPLCGYQKKLFMSTL